jgi:hypothetical protein
MEEQKTIKLELVPNEVKVLLEVLGEMPTKTNVWPLASKIMAQAQAANEPAQ